jgi:hypothetical protein
MNHDNTDTTTTDEADSSPSAEQAAKRHALAAELLQQGLPQPTVRERLMAELGVSRRTAYRVIEAAAAQLGMRTTESQQEGTPMSNTETAQHGATAAQTADTTTATETAEATPAAAATQGAEPLLSVSMPSFMAQTYAPGLVMRVNPPRAEPVRVRIAYMGAPWPEGAKVGHVVEFPAGQVPSWALGKCQAVSDTTPADFVHQPAAEVCHVPQPAPALWMAAPAQAEGSGTYAEQLQQALDRVARAEAELAPLLARRKAAADEVERLESARAAGASFGQGRLSDVPDVRTWHEMQGKARGEQSRADAKCASAQRTLEEAKTTAQRLDRIVSAAARLPAAAKARDEAAAAVEAAQAEVERMQGAIRRIDAELRSEETAQAELKRTAAAQLLERARSGQSLDDVTTPNEGRLNALREARAGAVDELAAATGKANQCRAALGERQRALASVEADGLVSEFEQAYRRLIDAAVPWMVAHYRASRELPRLPELRADAGKAFEAALEADRIGAASAAA